MCVSIFFVDCGLLIHREIFWHEEEPVQRSLGDLQDLPQQNDQTVRVSQSGRGNVCPSYWSLSSERTQLNATGEGGYLSLEQNSTASNNLFFSCFIQKYVDTCWSNLTCSKASLEPVESCSRCLLAQGSDLRSISSNLKLTVDEHPTGFFPLIFQVFFLHPDITPVSVFFIPDLGRGLLRDSDWSCIEFPVEEPSRRVLPVYMPALHATASSSISISVLFFYFLLFLETMVFSFIMAGIQLTVAVLARLHSEYQQFYPLRSIILCAIFKGFLTAWFRSHLEEGLGISIQRKEKKKQTNVDFKDPFILPV